ncbi:hypothetical protein TNIN_185311 [Trichonephila inaurata madagascariensis]|uniref:Uncharacterized protein n=1 Tax=Trichonephila inaurata madagascariensis TaxID=2747483 RepID=A0A8X6YI85_9ARAC|nr:hypothetical protein TNIN_185311 [Trichonephila inaurata madagascariensis]
MTPKQLKRTSRERFPGNPENWKPLEGKRKRKELLRSWGKGQGYWNKLLGKKLKPEKRAAFEVEFPRLREVREKLRDMKVELGNKAKELIEKLKEKAKDYWKKILEKLNLEKRSMELEEAFAEEEKRSIKDIYEKIKNYFKDLGIDLKEKFTKFGEWAKSQYEKGLEKSKDKLENVKNIAKKVRCF